MRFGVLGPSDAWIGRVPVDLGALAAPAGPLPVLRCAAYTVPRAAWARLAFGLGQT